MGLQQKKDNNEKSFTINCDALGTFDKIADICLPSFS